MALLPAVASITLVVEKQGQRPPQHPLPDGLS